MCFVVRATVNGSYVTNKIQIRLLLEPRNSGSSRRQTINTGKKKTVNTIKQCSMKHDQMPTTASGIKSLVLLHSPLISWLLGCFHAAVSASGVFNASSIILERCQTVSRNWAVITVVTEVGYLRAIHIRVLCVQDPTFPSGDAHFASHDGGYR